MLKNFSFGRDKTANSRLEEDRVAAARYTAQRELLRIVVKETLRNQGLQATWVGSELLSAGTQERGPEFRLVVQVWQDDLLRYLPAFQTLILAALNRVDPSLKASAQGVSWQFAADCGCPHDQLPHAPSWGKSLGVQALDAARQVAEVADLEVQSKPNAAAKQKFDLPASDMDRLHATDWDAIPSTYAATQPGFLTTQPAGIDPGKQNSKP